MVFKVKISFGKRYGKDDLLIPDSPEEKLTHPHPRFFLSMVNCVLLLSFPGLRVDDANDDDMFVALVASFGLVVHWLTPFSLNLGVWDGKDKLSLA